MTLEELNLELERIRNLEIDESDPKTSYVYALMYPGNLFPFYVGMSSKKNNGAEKVEDMYPRAYYGHNIQKSKEYWSSIIPSSKKEVFIKSFINKDLIIPVQILVDNITRNESCNWEIFYIKLFGRLDYNTGILTNHTEGGDGVTMLPKESLESISKHSSEALIKMYKNFTKEDWCNLRKHLTKISNEYHKNLPEDRKKDIYSRISKSNREFWSNLSCEKFKSYSKISSDNFKKYIYKDNKISEEFYKSCSKGGKSSSENIRKRSELDSNYKEFITQSRINGGIKGMKVLQEKRKLDPELDIRCKEAQLRALEKGRITWKNKFDSDPEFRERMRHRGDGIDFVYSKFISLMKKIWVSEDSIEEAEYRYNKYRETLINKKAYCYFKKEYYIKFLGEYNEN